MKKPRSKALIATEEQEQRAFVQWFRLQYPDTLIFAIPNGGFRFAKTAGLLKMSGVIAGVPDLFIPAWKLWVEMKRTQKSSTSDSQKEIIAYLKSCGYECFIAKGFCHARDQVLKYRRDMSSASTYPSDMSTNLNCIDMLLNIA